MRQPKLPHQFHFILPQLLTKSLKRKRRTHRIRRDAWRRCRDLNPSAGKTDLPDFESGPFNHLGTSPDMFELRFDGEKTEQIIKFC